MKHKIYLKKTICLLIIMVCGMNGFSQFSGAFAPSNWNFNTTTVGGDGSVNASGAPSSIILNGSDNGVGGGGQYEQYTITIPQYGKISFDFSHVNPDIDVAQYVINGVVTSITNSGIGSSTNILVNSGDVFSFRVTNDDNCCGRGVLTISNFVFIAGAALNFDGVDDKVVMSNSISSVLDPLNTITVEAWVNPTNTVFNGVIAGNYASPVGNMQFLLRRDGDSYTFWVDAGFGFQAVSSGASSVILNTWQHVAGVWNGSALYIYINGVLMSTTTGVTGSSFASTSNNVVIGSNSYPEPFAGSIDEVRIWTSARTQCDIISYKNCEIPTTAAGLIANYHFNQGLAADNNSTITSLNDASGSLNTGTLTAFALTGTTSNWIAPGGVISGSVTPSACTMASALNFDGINDYVSISSNALLSMTSAITIETWVKTTGSPTGEQYIITKSDDSYYMALNVGGNVGKASFFINGVSTGWLYSTSTNINDNNWHHVASTYDGAIIKIYIDGILENSVLASGAILTGGNNVNFGCRNNSLFLQGSIDEVRVWDVARTQCDIISYKNCEIPSTSTGLVANYHFNQGVDAFSNPTVATLTDASGNSNTGTLNNFALTGATSNWIAPGGVISGSITPSTCTPAAALKFDGFNDYVNSGVNAVLNLTTAITLEAWVNRSSTGNEDCIIGKDNFASNNGYSFWIYANNKFLLRFGNIEFVSTSTISAGSWNHLSATYSAGTVKLYLNGILDGSFTGVVNPVSNSGALFLGTPQDAIGNSAFAFGGSIDEVRVWDVARTQCEINTYKNCELPSTSTGLVANYHFNQGVDAFSNPTVASLTDGSGNFNTGTLNNFALSGSTSNWVAPGGVVSGFTTTLAPPTIAVNSGAICAGQSFTMVPSGAITYTFSNGSAIATPTAYATYSVSGSDANGCVSSTDAISSVTVNICTPAAALNFDGANDYVSISGTSADNLGSNQLTMEAWVNVNNYTDTRSIIRKDGDFNFYLFNGNVFAEVWSNGMGNATYMRYNGSTSISINVWTHVAFSYNKTSGTAMLYVNGVPENVTPNSNSIAVTGPLQIGESAVYGNPFFGLLDEVRIWNIERSQCEINTYKDCEMPASATGLIANYHFNQGFDAANNQTETILTDASGNFNTGTLLNFALSGSTSNWVAPGGVVSGYTTALAPPTISVNSGSICAGKSFTMTPSGAVTYTFSSGSAIVTPTAYATYSVSATDANGCVSSVNAISSVTVNALPTISVNSGAICAGQSFTMVPTGAATYTYSNGTDVVTPAANVTYSVSGTDANGCLSSVNAISSVTVNALPTISVNSGAICAGQSFTMVPAGASTYTYSAGTDVVMPTADASYSVSGTDANGCMSNVDAISSVTVNALPVLTTSTTNTLMCTGETATLSVTGAASYTWSTSETSANIIVTPTVQTTYTVDGISVNGCSSSTTITQDVSLCTGIIALNDTQLMNVYPNPNNGTFIVELSGVSMVSISNTLGQIIMSESLDQGKHNLSIQNQSNGIYFVKVIQGGKQNMIKLIKE